MSAQKDVLKQAERRKLRVRKKLLSRGVKLRVSVFRSLKHIYAQIIDDAAGKTLVSFSSHRVEEAGDKKAIAYRVGIELGKIAQAQAISEVFFDRGSCAYQGRVAALAQGLRESGLKF